MVIQVEVLITPGTSSRPNLLHRDKAFKLQIITEVGLRPEHQSIEVTHVLRQEIVAGVRAEPLREKGEASKMESISGGTSNQISLILETNLLMIGSLGSFPVNIVKILLG
jgi:hypothetical protein